ncbi:MAG TPA: hypothetical protein EYH01_00880 [Campylobacterales bacterium]|nr:hypothetical protein [Campylobacterales bacterium]HIP58963.1 hypothetical protein [Campylobacterales bacterium]
MKEIVITLVFMMALLAFAVFPAVKLVEFISKKRELTHKMQNFLTLLFTVSIAFCGALFLKFV